MAWVIKHDLIGELHDDDSEAVQQVKDEKMTGTEFLIDYCDTKFWSEDVADELVPFLQEYYQENYFQDYCQWVIEDLCDLPMEFIGTWEDYHEFEPVIDRAYEAYCQSREK